MKSFVSCLLALACLLPPAGAAGQSGEAVRRPTQGGGRLAPPPRLRCPRDQTTSFTGLVTRYRRARGRVFVRVRTDEETTEAFSLRYVRGGDPGRVFLLRGETFTRRDWRRIERPDGRLRPGTRATVWACYDGDEPRAELIDWSPPEG